MRARVGKIARLPEQIREELNRKLKNGARAKNLVAWLNQIPDVNAMLAECFAGHPIREQNISEWRAGGYQDWLEEQRWIAQMVLLRENSADLIANFASLVPRRSSHL